MGARHTRLCRNPGPETCTCSRLRSKRRRTGDGQTAPRDRLAARFIAPRAARDLRVPGTGEAPARDWRVAAEYEPVRVQIPGTLRRSGPIWHNVLSTIIAI